MFKLIMFVVTVYLVVVMSTGCVALAKGSQIVRQHADEIQRQAD